MSNKSPGYKTYQIEGSNYSIPGWLIQHRGESVDKAVTAATNALVPTDVQRNLIFRDAEKNINPVINTDKAFKILAVIPTEVPDVLNSTSGCLDNQFKFELLDERFINQEYEVHNEAALSSFLRHKAYESKQVAIDSILNLDDIVDAYKESNPTLTTLWGSIKAARDILRNDPYKIYNSDDKYKVLLTNPAAGEDKVDDKVIYGKVTAAYLDPESIGNSVAQAQEHLYDDIHSDSSNNKSKVNQVLSVTSVNKLGPDNELITTKDLKYSYITDEFIYGSETNNIDVDDTEVDPDKLKLWNTIKKARYILEDKLDDTNKLKVLQTDANGELSYAKIDSEHLADSISNILIDCNDPSLFI